jgi:hypothetical protein
MYIFLKCIHARLMMVLTGVTILLSILFIQISSVNAAFTSYYFNLNSWDGPLYIRATGYCPAVL